MYTFKLSIDLLYFDPCRSLVQTTGFKAILGSMTGDVKSGYVIVIRIINVLKSRFGKYWRA